MKPTEYEVIIKVKLETPAPEPLTKRQKAKKAKALRNIEREIARKTQPAQDRK
jgi:hypothetical protein